MSRLIFRGKEVDIEGCQFLGFNKRQTLGLWGQSGNKFPLLDPFLSKIFQDWTAIFLGGVYYIYLLPLIMSNGNQYHIRYYKLLPRIVSHKHNRNVKWGKIYGITYIVSFP